MQISRADLKLRTHRNRLQRAIDCESPYWRWFQDPDGASLALGEMFDGMQTALAVAAEQELALTAPPAEAEQ